MRFLTLFQQILHEMWGQKMRSFLALFGIVFGTITVILLLALGSGFHQTSKHDLMDIAEGTFFAWSEQLSKSYRGLPQGTHLKIRSHEIMELPKEVPSIIASSPILENNAHISANNNQTTTMVHGVSVDFAKMRKLTSEAQGRLFNPLDIAKKRRVVIIGEKLKKTLFGNHNAIGKTLLINHADFTVIGVISKDCGADYQYSNNAIIPYTTSISLWGDQSVPYFIALPSPDADPRQAQNMMMRYFAHKLHYDPTDTTALKVYDTTKMFQFFKWFLIGVQIFLGICGALTLGVGAVSVANIMFLSVTERTREIGLRLAIGASNRDVMLHILLETLIIVSLGGFLGFLVSYGTVEGLQHVTLPKWLGKPKISIESVLITLTTLSVLGLLAGYFPAKRAAKMDPIEALTK